MPSALPRIMAKFNFILDQMLVGRKDNSMILNIDTFRSYHPSS